MFIKDEHDEDLNADVVEPAIRRLRDVGLTVDVGSPAGGTIVVRSPEGGSTAYGIEVRRQMTAALAGTLSSRDSHPIVIAPYIADDAAEVLRSREIDFVDMAGNLHLLWPGVRIDVRGRRRSSLPHDSRRGQTASQAFTRSGAQVVFVVLSWPETASATVRDVARRSGVSVGAAQKALADLAGEGYLHDRAGTRTLSRGGELLSRWTEAYALRLGPKLLLGTFAVKEPRWWIGAENRLRDNDAQLGGEVAASVVDSRLRPSTADVYVRSIPARLVAQYRMTPDDDGTVFFRHRFWTRPETEPDVASDLVPLPLVYADLLATGEPRQREHAERLRESDDRLARLDGP